MLAAATATARSGTPSRSPRSKRPVGMWVIVGVPVLLGLLSLWQVASGLVKTEIIVRNAVAVSRVSLEQDAQGARVDMAFVDRAGADTTVSGDVVVKVREPDGRLWRTTRTVSAGDFVTLPTGSLLAGRLGYAVVIPVTDWVRAPRRGGAATVSVNVLPSDGSDAFSTVAEERFP